MVGRKVTYLFLTCFSRLYSVLLLILLLSQRESPSSGLVPGPGDWGREGGLFIEWKGGREGRGIFLLIKEKI